MLNKDALPLQNLQNAKGKYELYWQDKLGNLVKINKVGLSKQPFQVVALYKDVSFAAVQKNGNSRNDKDLRLFLINLKNGSLAVGDERGLAQIKYNKQTKILYCIPFISSCKVAQTFVWVLSNIASTYTILNMPMWSKRNVSVVNSDRLLPAVAYIKSRTKSECAKSIKVKPGQKCGRPKGTTKKFAIDTTKKQEKRVRLHNLSQAPVAPVYDVYLNDERVMGQCLGANAKTFMDNRVLAVAFLQQATLKETYNVFMPDGSLWTAGQHQPVNSLPVEITGVAEKNGDLQLHLSNNSVQVIRASDLARFAPMQFVLDEKQR